MFYHGGRVVAEFSLRDPFIDVCHIGIELFGLFDGVEDPEIGCRIAARTGSPLPVTVIGRQLVVEELFREICFAPPPVDQQVFA